MIITLRRSETPRRGTFWRPVQHTYEQREFIEEVRRKVPGDAPDKYARYKRTVPLAGSDLLLAGANREYTPARIEHQYRRDRFVEGFVYVRALASFVHEDEVEWAETKPHRIGVGSIIAKGVRIGSGAHIGPYTELEHGVRLEDGATVGEHSVIRKHARLGAGAQVGAHGYVGQSARLATEAQVGSMSMLERQTRLEVGTVLGSQNRIGVGTYLAADAWTDDSVRIGRHGFIGENVMIGEMTTIGDRTHIGDLAGIGAESRFGSFVKVGRGVRLVSPTYADDGALLLHSTIGAQHPKD